ncbi:hypothetical protein LPJ72_002024 [Coemansia sp. Benny D160-2]|nr:hypothetical protein LPJ72_002024 [Coemansia sp. Benny D160-2]
MSESNNNSSATRTTTNQTMGDSIRVRARHSRSIGAESGPLGSDGLQGLAPGLAYGWGGHSSGSMGVHNTNSFGSAGATSSSSLVPPLPQKCVSRRSSVVSTSSSFFDRSFFSTPESRIVDHGKKATLSYATLMLNIYNNVSLDIRTAVDSSRRIVVQTVASKNKAAQLSPDLARVHADASDAVDTVRSINGATEFASIKDLLCHSLQVYEDIKQASAS